MAVNGETDVLKPCPHCSSDAHWSPTYVDADEPGTVTCAGGCGATVICSGPKSVRVAAWNLRADDPTEYLIWSEEHRAWWRPGSMGYTNQMTKSGRYTAELAAVIVRNANIGGQFNECMVPIDQHISAILARAKG